MQVPASVRRALASDPDAYLDDLVAVLTNGIEGDSLKAKIIHDWLADNIQYDVAAFYADNIPDQGATDVLRTGKSVCQGFANLFERMCTLAGIECVTISGYGRGYGFAPSRPEDPSKENHAWNAVRLCGQWRLVDVTWDAGCVDGSKYVKRYSNQFWLAAPEAFAPTHLPEDPQWQLLEQPLSAEQFVAMPFLRPDFFLYGLSLTTQLGKINSVGATAEILISTPADVWLMADLVRVGGRDSVGAECSRDGALTRIQLQFPKPGGWEMGLYARRGSRAGQYGHVGEFGFVSGQTVP